MNLYDIAIIGSGPCGSLLSLLLAKKGYSIVLIDKRNLDSNPPIRAKACGGLLSPDAQRVLASLDLNLPNSVLSDPQLFSVKTIDIDTNMCRYYQRFYLNMDREKFDRYLTSLLPENVHKRYSSLVNSIEYFDNEYVIKTNQNDIIRARILVGCDGAGSLVRKTFFSNEKFKVKQYYAIQHVYKCEEKGARYYAIFDKSLTDYSGWAFPKNDTFTVGMAFPVKSDGNFLFENLIEKLRKYGLSLSELISREG
ncbi:MAG: FAD-dependent monooxygenase, partial [Clostridia bacterium]